MPTENAGKTVVEAGLARADYPIPNVINLFGLLFSVSLAVALLILASQAYRGSHWGLLALWSCLFGFFNNTNFAFLHEAVHGVLNSRRSWNQSLGILAGAFFPASFSLQQCFHLGHHCRNRTDAEMFDLYYPTDNLWVKRLVIYAMPSGLYWLTAVLANLICPLLPVVWKWMRLRETMLMRLSGFESMMGGVPDSQRLLKKIRMQVVIVLCVQAMIIIGLGVHPVAWLACYWVFGMIWGSLQYTDHAFSRRDVRYGAWNLKVDPITRWVFLNYHYHLAHHTHPNLPWIYLPRFVTRDEERPSSWGNFWKLMRGPVPATEPEPRLNRELNRIILDVGAESRSVGRDR